AATAAGRSIRQVARLPTEAIAALVDEDGSARARNAADASGPRDAAAIVQSALVAAQSLDEQALDATLRRAVAVLGLASFIERVAAPLMRRVGDEWHAGRLSIA